MFAEYFKSPGQSTIQIMESRNVPSRRSHCPTKKPDFPCAPRICALICIWSRASPSSFRFFSSFFLPFLRRDRDSVLLNSPVETLAFAGLNICLRGRNQPRDRVEEEEGERKRNTGLISTVRSSTVLRVVLNDNDVTRPRFQDLETIFHLVHHTIPIP